MKFKHNTTGTVLEPRSRMVEEQLAKSTEYSPYEDVPAGEKPREKMNKAELAEIAKAAGVEIPDGATKADILNLLEAKGE